MITQNGYFSNSIFLERGCRQGDPVFPYIVVIFEEVLGKAIREKDHKGSHYANDTTQLLKNDVRVLHRVLDTLKFFHSVSGLK